MYRSYRPRRKNPCRHKASSFYVLVVFLLALTLFVSAIRLLVLPAEKSTSPATRPPVQAESSQTGAVSVPGEVVAPEDLAHALDQALSATAVQAGSNEGVSTFAHAQFKVADSIEQVAQNLLQHYQEQQNCILAGSGWIDLTGNTWGCLVQGGRWVDVCLVQAADVTEGKYAKVEVIRLEKAEWESLQKA